MYGVLIVSFDSDYGVIRGLPPSAPIKKRKEKEFDRTRGYETP